MRTFPYLFLLLCLACQPKANKKQFSSNLELDLQSDEHHNAREWLPEPDVLERLQFQLDEIDSAKASHLLFADIVYQTPKKFELNEWVDMPIEANCIIWSDKNGAIVLIEETLTFNGDEKVVYTHYFDKKKKTFAFIRTSHFNREILKKAMANEIITEFYDNAFNRLHRKYALTDNNNIPIKKFNHYLFDDFPFEVYGNLEDYLLKLKEE